MSVETYIRELGRAVNRDNEVTGLTMLIVGHLDKAISPIRESHKHAKTLNAILTQISKVQKASIAPADYTDEGTYNITGRMVYAAVNLYSHIRVIDLKSSGIKGAGQYGELLSSTYKLCLLIKLNLLTPAHLMDVERLVKTLEDNSLRYPTGNKNEARRISVACLKQALAERVNQPNDYYFKSKVDIIINTARRQLTKYEVHQVT